MQRIIGPEMYVPWRREQRGVGPETHGPLHELGTGDGSQLKQWSPRYEQQTSNYPTHKSVCRNT